MLSSVGGKMPCGCCLFSIVILLQWQVGPAAESEKVRIECRSIHKNYRKNTWWRRGSNKGSREHRVWQCVKMPSRQMSTSNDKNMQLSRRVSRCRFPYVEDVSLVFSSLIIHPSPDTNMLSWSVKFKELRSCLLLYCYLTKSMLCLTV